MTERKTFTAEAKVLDENEGIVTAFVNTMGRKDSDNDIISPAAFDNSIQANLPIPVLLGHDSQKVIGKVISAYAMPIDEEEHRLHATMQFNLDTEDGRDAFSNVSGRYIKQWSVGFNLPSDSVEVERDGREIVRRIKELDWVETSAVIRGASPDTGTISAKTEESNIEPTTQDAASDTEHIDEPDFQEPSVSDTELAKAKLSLLKTKLKLRKNSEEEKET